MSKADLRESIYVLGEMAASRLFALIHSRIEELHATQGLTQADIAARVGVSEQRISHWLSEPRNMTVRSAGRLLGALESHLLFEIDRFEDIAGQANQASAVGTAAQVNSFVLESPTSSPEGSDRGCLLCKGADDDERFDYCRACGRVATPPGKFAP